MLSQHHFSKTRSSWHVRLPHSGSTRQGGASHRPQGSGAGSPLGGPKAVVGLLEGGKPWSCWPKWLGFLRQFLVWEGKHWEKSRKIPMNSKKTISDFVIILRNYSSSQKLKKRKHRQNGKKKCLSRQALIDTLQ